MSFLDIRRQISLFPKVNKHQNSAIGAERAVNGQIFMPIAKTLAR